MIDFSGGQLLDDAAVMIQFADVLRAGNEGDEHLPAATSGTDILQFDARARGGQRVPGRIGGTLPLQTAAA